MNKKRTDRQCLYCGDTSLDRIDINLPGFRHSDFRKVLSSISLLQCRNCQLVRNMSNDGMMGGVEKIYKGDEYFNLKKTHYISFAPSDGQEVVTVYRARAEFLRSCFSNNSPSILDIGCLDGKGLLEFETFFPKGDFHGFDLNPNIQSIFPQKSNYTFWAEDLANIPHQFDAILLANTIQYVPDLNSLFNQIKKLLKPDGFLFVEVIDFSVNPYVLLYGDQVNCFSGIVLKNVLAGKGLHFEGANCTWARRNVAGVARISKAEVKNHYEKEPAFFSVPGYFDDLVWKLKQIKAPSRIGVLGSTLNAALISELLKEKILFFVDENIHKVGGLFHGKPIIHPEELETSDTVIIPYGITAEQIRTKLAEKFPARFFCV